MSLRCGRFAPSPTGPLHLGSLVAAVGSYLDARAHSGRWLLRIEDVDEPRTVPGSAEQIEQQLAAHGLTWDGPVVYQSARRARYEEALTRLEPWTFPCTCNRRDALKCRCREGLPPGQEGRSIRLAGEGGVEDFVIRRADGFFSYQLAVVVDDGEQGVTDVVRGADLIDSTPRQNLLQRRLGYPVPRYLHLPLVCGPDGEKLSKQNAAPALGLDAAANLRWAIAFLGQPVPGGESVERILAAAVTGWDPRRIPCTVDRRFLTPRSQRKV